METQEQRRALEQELQKIKGTYTRGTEVVVNVDGDWVRGKLTSDSEPEGSTLKLQVEYTDAQGHIFTAEKRVEIERTEEGLQLKDAPKIIKYTQADPNTRSLESGRFLVNDVHITEKGDIEYSISELDSTVAPPIYRTKPEAVGVPQEYIDLWKETEDLQKKLKDLKDRIKGDLSTKNQLKFLGNEQRRESQDEQGEGTQSEDGPVLRVEKQIAEMMNALPNIDKMNKRDREQIESLHTRLSDLSKKAATEIKRLSDAVDDAQRIETAQRTAPTREVHHVRTAVEKEQERKEHEELKEHAEKLRVQIDKENAKRLKKIEDDEKEELEDLVDTEKVAYDAKLLAWTAMTKQAQNSTPSLNPGKFEPEKIKLPLARRKDIRIEKEKVKKDIYQKVYEKLKKGTEIDKKLAELIDTKRKNDAKNDLTADDADLLKPAGPVEDYVANTAIFAQKNIEAIDVVLADENIGLQEEQVPEGKEAFDFDAKYTELKNKIDTLITSFPADSDKDFDKNSIAELRVQLKKLQEEYPKLLSLGKAFSSGVLSGTDGENELRKKRVNLINEVGEIVENIELLKSQEDAKKTLADHVDGKENKEADAESVIDIPEYLMRELLTQRETEVRVAVHTLFSGGVERAEDGRVTVTPEALTQFKNIFSDTRPGNTPEIANIMAKLRECGIKDWEYFKKIWDEKLALQSLATMHEMATALVRRNVSENITWRDKLNKNWGQIASRLLISAGLVGGAAFGASLLVASGGLLGVGAAVVGGAVGGAVRGGLNRWIFESRWVKKLQEKNQQALETEKKTAVIDGLTNQLMAGVLNAGTVGQNSTGTTKIDGLPSFAAIMAQGIRDLTTEIKKLNESEPDEAKKLGGNARLLYEQALMHLETKNPDEKQKRELAIAISKMNGQGEKNFEAIKGSVDTKIMGVLEKAMGSYSGKGKYGIATSATLGGMIGGAIFEYNEYARLALGGVLGGIAGLKEGAAADMRETRRIAKERVYADITNLRNASIRVLRDNTDLSNLEKKNLQEPLIRLKRLLHVNVTDPSELAVYGIVGKAAEDKKIKVKNAQGVEEEQTVVYAGDLIDHAGNTVVTKDGRIVSAELRGLMQDLRSAVRDAERSGILHEEKEERMKMDTVLETMKGHGDKIEEKYTEGMSAKQRSWWQRNKNKVKFGVGGAVGGAVAALALGYGAKAMVEHVKKDWLHIGDIEGMHIQDKSDIAAASKAAGIEEGQASRGGRGDQLEGASRSERGGIDTEVPGTEISPTQEPHVFAEATIEKGQGVLHGLNDFKGAKPDMSGWSTEEQKAWEDFSHKSKSEFHDWKMQQLKEMGFVWKGGKLGYPFTVHPGAEMKLFLGNDGEFHARFVDNGKVSMHDRLHFRGSAKAVDVSTARPAPATEVASAPEPVQDIQPHGAENVGALKGVGVLEGDSTRINHILDETYKMHGDDARIEEVYRGKNGEDDSVYVTTAYTEDGVVKRISDRHFITGPATALDYKGPDYIGAGGGAGTVDAPATSSGARVPEGAEPSSRSNIEQGKSTKTSLSKGEPVSSDRSGVFAKDFLESGKAVTPQGVEAPSTSESATEGDMATSAESTNIEVKGWIENLSGYSDSYLAHLDQQGSVTKSMFDAVTERLAGIEQKPLPPEAVKVLNGQGEEIYKIRMLADIFSTEGTFRDLTPEQKLFIGGSHIQDPTEFAKAKVLSEDGTKYIAEAYIPIIDGVASSNYAALQFPDKRGYMFFSSTDTVFKTDIDDSGEAIMQYIDMSGSEPTVKPFQLAQR